MLSHQTVSSLLGDKLTQTTVQYNSRPLYTADKFIWRLAIAHPHTYWVIGLFLIKPIRNYPMLLELQIEKLGSSGFSRPRHSLNVYHSMFHIIEYSLAERFLAFLITHCRFANPERSGGLGEAPGDACRVAQIVMIYDMGFFTPVPNNY